MMIHTFASPIKDNKIYSWYKSHTVPALKIVLDTLKFLIEVTVYVLFCFVFFLMWLNVI